MSDWLISHMMGSTEDAPKVKCKRSYAVFAISRKSRFPDIFESSAIEPYTVTTAYEPREVIYGKDPTATQTVKLIGRHARTVLPQETIAALHVDQKVIPIVSERPKPKAHFTVEKNR